MRLAAFVRAQIASGKVAPGSALPSITDLAAAHEMSRQTVGKGLHVLEREGVIYRVPGLGYHVSLDAVQKIGAGR